LKPAGNSPLKPRKTPKRDSKGEMVKEAKKAKVHRQKQAKTVLKTVSLCLLPTCRKPFIEKKLLGRLGGRRREFCSPGCKEEFFQLARRVGAALLRRVLADPEAEKYVKGLLEKVGAGRPVIFVVRDGNLERAIKRLKKFFDLNLSRELRIRQYHLTRSQRRKLKDARVLMKLKKRMGKQEDYDKSRG
jgi:ribosomal protein S21